jgi:hypothetical protein
MQDIYLKAACWQGLEYPSLPQSSQECDWEEILGRFSSAFKVVDVLVVENYLKISKCVTQDTTALIL